MQTWLHWSWRYSFKSSFSVILCHILGFPWKFGYITLQFEMFLFGPHGVSVYQWLSGPNIFLGKTRRPETLAMPKEPLVEISVWGRNWPGNKPSITFTVDLAVVHSVERISLKIMCLSAAPWSVRHFVDSTAERCKKGARLANGRILTFAFAQALQAQTSDLHKEQITPGHPLPASLISPVGTTVVKHDGYLPSTHNSLQRRLGSIFWFLKWYVTF